MDWMMKIDKKLEVLGPIQTDLAGVSQRMDLLQADNDRFKNELMIANEKIRAIEKSNRYLEESLKKLSQNQAKVEETEKKVSETGAKVVNLQQENAGLKNSQIEMGTRITQLEVVDWAAGTLKKRMDEADQNSRRKNLILTGVPEIPNEMPKDTVARIATAYGFGIHWSEVDAAHRLPRKDPSNGPRPFIIKFVNRHVKEQFRYYAKQLKPTAKIFGGSEQEKIYVGEHLTKETLQLRRYAREKLSGKGFIVDNIECNVFVWKPKQRKIKIVSRDQVDAIYGEN
jgi:hypothetical protein